MCIVSAERLRIRETLKSRFAISVAILRGGNSEIEQPVPLSVEKIQSELIRIFFAVKQYYSEVLAHVTVNWGLLGRLCHKPRRNPQLYRSLIAVSY